MTGPRAIAVTGASGFIGRHLCDRFRLLGWETRALVRKTSSYPFKSEGVKLFECDLPDRIDAAAFEGTTVVAHLAYMTRFTDMASAQRVNDAGTRAVVELARKAGARLVFLSSQSAHEEAQSYYGKSKLALERLFSPDHDVILRSGLVLGKEGDGLFHRMCDMVRSSKVIPLFGGGRQPIQTIHMDDLCGAIEGAVTKNLPGLFTVAEPRSHEMRGLLQSIASRLGKKPIFVPFPIAPTLLGLRAIEALHLPFPVSSENLLGLKCLRATDTSRDLAALGVSARDMEASLTEILGPSGA